MGAPSFQMAGTTAGGVAIEGIAAYLPSGVVANGADVAKATGIVERHVVDDGSSALDLCLNAAAMLFDSQGGFDAADFGAVINVSFTQRERMPCGACRAQARLGLPKGVVAFDVMQACAGYGYGLYLSAMLAAQTGKKVLLLDGDRQSEFLDAGDAATSPLLGDCGTATVIGKKEEGRRKKEEGGEEGGWKFAFASDGEKGDALRLEKGGTIRMDGFGVFRFVATDVAAMLKGFIASAATGGDFLFAPHQANVYMVRQLAKAVGVPEDRLLVSADRFGNLSSASIPATLAAHAESVRGRNVLLAGFGGGLSAAFAFVDVPAGCKIRLLASRPGFCYNTH